jgi:hypothetical protein
MSRRTEGSLTRRPTDVFGLSTGESGSGILRDTVEILRRGLSQRFLEHRDKGRHGFIAEIGRNLLYASAGSQLSYCDDQMQLLTPTAEGQPCLLDDETCESALAEGDAIGRFSQCAAVGRVFCQP